ncbi:uncharacterized protein LOC122297469 [Carya illinoinensis]|uniref:uncharacterized protein LOC122297469 n=1 Tax=Carya illinoinensis TaxID=32201 RepID=UPI001C724913|nr:uncharacterized protein LOC122297469 [Carya illinoinensis]
MKSGVDSSEGWQFQAVVLEQMRDIVTVLEVFFNSGYLSNARSPLPNNLQQGDRSSCSFPAFKWYSRSCKFSPTRCSRGHHWLNKKTIADVVKALVGVFIVDSGFRAAIAFLRWIGI